MKKERIALAILSVRPWLPLTCLSAGVFDFFSRVLYGLAGFLACTFQGFACVLRGTIQVFPSPLSRTFLPATECQRRAQKRSKHD